MQSRTRLSLKQIILTVDFLRNSKYLRVTNGAGKTEKARNTGFFENLAGKAGKLFSSLLNFFSA